MAKHVRPNRTELVDPRFMPEEARTVVARNKLNKGDVLVTRTGANFGQTAAWMHSYEAFACADVLVIRSPSIPSGYLSSFLESSIGKALVRRAGYGAAQPHIAPRYLANVLVPRFKSIEARIDALVDLSAATGSEALDHVAQAQDTLLAFLGLVDWMPPEPQSYAVRAMDALEANRLDPGFFAPRVRALLEMLTRDGQTVGDVAVRRRQKFHPSDSEWFHYIEIGNIDRTGVAEGQALAGSDAPGRATWYVEPGDIITSTVRPLRRLTARIGPEQGGHVCSSGFVVIAPHGVLSDVLLTYLRLPVICELLDLYASASMYPAISDVHILGLPIPEIDSATQNSIATSMRDARAARGRALEFLGTAKRAVEVAVEEGEGLAVNFLDRARSAS